MMQGALWIRGSHYWLALVDGMAITGVQLCLHLLRWLTKRDTGDITVFGYLLVAKIVSYINSRHSISKYEHLSYEEKMLKLVSEFLLMLKLESKYLSIPESKISGENWNILVVHYFSSLLFFIYHMWYNSRPKETRCDWIFHPHEMYQLSCEANKILCVWVHMGDYLYCSSTLEHLTYLDTNLIFYMDDCLPSSQIIKMETKIFFNYQ